MTSTELYHIILARHIPHDHHESDLYIPVTEETRALIRQYQFRSNVTTFISNIEKTPWYDVPFAYLPFWEKVQRRAAKEGA